MSSSNIEVGSWKWEIENCKTRLKCKNWNSCFYVHFALCTVGYAVHTDMLFFTSRRIRIGDKKKDTADKELRYLASREVDSKPTCSNEVSWQKRASEDSTAKAKGTTQRCNICTTSLDYNGPFDCPSWQQNIRISADMTNLHGHRLSSRAPTACYHLQRPKPAIHGSYRDQFGLFRYNANEFDLNPGL